MIRFKDSLVILTHGPTLLGQPEITTTRRTNTWVGTFISLLLSLFLNVSPLLRHSHGSSHRMGELAAGDGGSGDAWPHREGEAATVSGDRAHCIRELHLLCRHRGPRQRPNKQVLRGHARKSLLWRQRVHRRDWEPLPLPRSPGEEIQDDVCCMEYGFIASDVFPQVLKIFRHQVVYESDLVLISCCWLIQIEVYLSRPIMFVIIYSRYIPDM